jgi:hypothetical protein
MAWLFGIRIPLGWFYGISGVRMNGLLVIAQVWEKGEHIALD